jgi:hypothetical protein
LLADFDYLWALHLEGDPPSALATELIHQTGELKIYRITRRSPGANDETSN